MGKGKTTEMNPTELGLWLLENRSSRIFLDTNLLTLWLSDGVSTFYVGWSKDYAVREGEERPQLAQTCFTVFLAALEANPEINPLPKVVEAARGYLRCHAEMLESAEAGAGIVNLISQQLQLRGLSGLLP